MRKPRGSTATEVVTVFHLLKRGLFSSLEIALKTKVPYKCARQAIRFLQRIGLAEKKKRHDWAYGATEKARGEVRA